MSSESRLSSLLVRAYPTYRTASCRSVRFSFLVWGSGLSSAHAPFARFRHAFTWFVVKQEYHPRRQRPLGVHREPVHHWLKYLWWGWYAKGHSKESIPAVGCTYRTYAEAFVAQHGLPISQDPSSVDKYFTPLTIGAASYKYQDQIVFSEEGLDEGRRTKAYSDLFFLGLSKHVVWLFSKFCYIVYNLVTGGIQGLERLKHCCHSFRN